MTPVHYNSAEFTIVQNSIIHEKSQNMNRVDTLLSLIVSLLF